LASIARISLLLLWEGVCRLFQIPPYILPAPTAIAGELFQSLGLLAGHGSVTLFIALSGLALSLPSGVLTAYMMDRYSFLKDFLYPLLIISQTIPIIFIYPLLLIWLGFGILPKILVVFLVCFFPITVNVFKGFQHSSEELMDLLRSMNATPGFLYKKVKWPGSLPDFFSGLKIAVTYSIMGAVIGEWLGASKGLGVYMIRSYKTFNTAGVFAAILLVVATTLMLFKFLEIIEKKALPWRQERKEI